MGIVLNYYLGVSETSDVLSKAAFRALGQMISKTKSNYDLGFATYTKLFDCTVNPILEYAIGAWGVGCKGAPHKKLDQVQNRAMRFFCGVPRFTPLASLYGDMNWLPGVIKQDIANLRLYNQIICMDRNCLTSKILMCDRCSPNPNSWSANVKNISSSIGMSENWDKYTPVNLSVAKKKLMEWYENFWKIEIQRKSKL